MARKMRIFIDILHLFGAMFRNVREELPALVIDDVVGHFRFLANAIFAIKKNYAKIKVWTV